MSSTVQFFRIRPNLLPEKRPSTSPPRSRARIRLRHFRDHGVRDVEAEGVVDARQMVDADQHEGAGRRGSACASSIASASAAIRWVRLSSPVRGSCRDSFTSCSSRAWRSLLRRTMPCARAGLPSGPANQRAGFLDPEHRRRRRGPHAIFDAVGRAVAAVRQRRRRQRVGPDRAHRLDQPGEFGAAGERVGGISENTEAACSLQAIASVAISQTKAAWPSEARMVDACGGASVTVASFRDIAGSDSSGESQDRADSADHPLIIRKPSRTTARERQKPPRIDLAGLQSFGKP